MAQLRKDDTQNLKSPASGPGDHPLFNGKTTVGMISGEAPRFPAQAAGHEALGNQLKQMGLRADSRDGCYGGPEKSWMVYGPTREQMYTLGKQFGQESVVFSQAGKHELMYTNGPNTGRYHPSLDHDWFTQAPEDYYTHMPELGGYLRLNFDWDQLHDSQLGQTHAIDALNSRATHGSPPPAAAAAPGSTPDGDVQKSLLHDLAVELDEPIYSAEDLRAAILSTLRKSLPTMAVPHPHAYPWHNEHTDHHLHVASPGVVLRSTNNGELMKAMPAHPHMDGSKPPDAQKPENDQAAGAGVSTYAKYAMPYGSVDKTKPADLFHYPYQGKARDVNRLVQDHGYNVYYAGGKYGRPDLANRNYNTKHLMIYDPSPGSGGDFGTEEYTDNWRKVHELAHALTYPDLNKVYGEGRRIGKLGHHRTLREGLRAVHWEWLAAHKQRELSQQLGIHVPDHVFHKELNTVMHDAIHRAVTGKFTEPSGEGYRPHEHKIPLETGLGMIREAAHNLGITGMHDLIKKSEETMVDDSKIHEPQEWRKELAKALRDRVDQYSQQMLELRQRELKKNLGADPALAGPAPQLNPLDNCPLCGMPDVPGQCKCLQGPAAPMVKSDSDDKYNYYLVHKETGHIVGGNEYKEDAHDAAKDHPEASKIKVTHRTRVSPEAKAKFHGDNKIDGKLHKDEVAGYPAGDADGMMGKGDDDWKVKGAGGNAGTDPKPKGTKDNTKSFINRAKPAGEMLKTEMCKAHGKAGCCGPEMKKGSILGAGMSEKGKAADVDQSDIEYIKQRQAKEKAKAAAAATAVGPKPTQKAELSAKAKEPVKPAGGNGIKIKKLNKAGIPMARDIKTAMMHDPKSGPPAAAAPAAPRPKLPGMAAQSQRAAGLNDFMPAGKFSGPGAGLPKPAAAAAKPAMPPAGTAHLKSPMPAPATGAAKLPAPGAAPAAPKPAAAALPKPAAPKSPAAPKPSAAPSAATMKAEQQFADLKKSLGNCPLCKKAEHLGACS